MTPTPPKINNCIIMDFNYNEADEIFNKKFKRMVIRINEMKEDTYKHLSIQISSRVKYSYEREMQDVREEFNNNISILKTSN
jgi:hypothetical protein